MMTSELSRARIDRAFVGRKKILPDELFGGVLVFSFQRVRQVDFPKSSAQIVLMEQAHGFDLPLQWCGQGSWKHCQSILLALAITHRNFPAIEIDVLDPQPHRL